MEIPSLKRLKGKKERTQRSLNENLDVKLVTILKITSSGMGPWENGLVRSGSW